MRTEFPQEADVPPRAPHHDQILPQQLHMFTVPARDEFSGVHDWYPVVAHELAEGCAWANAG
jgi:hypothetical protein